MKNMLILLLAFLFVFSSISIAFADDGAMVADVLLLRPLGIASLVAGSAIFIVSLPITAVNLSVSESAEELVVKPFKYTFQRPIGENSPDYNWR